MNTLEDIQKNPNTQKKKTKEDNKDITDLEIKLQKDLKE